MVNRECRLLVLSPRVRDPRDVLKYKPFGTKRLLDIMDEVAAGVATRRARDYEQHAVFEGFFYGRTKLDDALKSELGDRVPSCIIDCAVYTDGADPKETQVAKSALFHFAYGHPADGKLIVLLCNHNCTVPIEFDTYPAVSDDALRAHLWGDLCGNKFKKIGNEIARRSHD